MTAPMVRILGLLGAALLLASCSGPLFSKIEVKASPTVYAALGNAKANISDYMSVGKVQDMLKGVSGAKVYDYQDSTGIQKYLIQLPVVKPFELDLGEYMKGLKLEDTLGQTLNKMSFPIPKVNQTQTSSASFDLNATLQTSINGGFSQQTVPFVETGSPTSISATLPDVPITVSKFSSATFSAGSMNLVLSMAPGASAGLALTATISLVDSGTGSTITSTATPVDIKAGGTATLPLAGKTLPSAFKIRFTATTSGGTSPVPTPKSDTINVTPSLVGIALSDAAGVSFTTTVDVPAVSVDMKAESTFVNATVGAGTLTINLGALPTGWNGFTRTTNLTLNQPGGLSINLVNQPGAAIPIDLANKTIGSANMNITATSTITAAAASFSGLTGSIPLSFGAEIVITKFASVTVKPATFTPTQSFSQKTPDDLKKWVNWVDFTSVGLKLEFTNNLPATNDMQVTVESKAFAIPSSTQTLPSGIPETTVTTRTFLNPSPTYRFIPSDVTKPDLDFKVSLAPKSYNSTTGELILYDITPGDTLTFGGSVSLVNVWSFANIKPPAGGQTGKFPETGKTDLSVLGDYLGTGLGLGPIDAYLYVSGLTLGAGDVLTGLVQATYAGAPVGGYPVLTDTPTTNLPASIKMVSGPPTLVTTLPGGDIIDAVVNSGANALKTGSSDISAKLNDLAVPLNAKPSDLVLNYALDLTSLTIDQASTKVGGVPKKLQADMILVVPVVMVSTSDTAELKVGNALPTTDLFGRKAGSDNSSTNNLLDKLVAMNMGLAIDNKIGFGGVATLVDGGTDGTLFKKTLELSPGISSPSLTLTSADIRRIRDNVPFVLKLKVQVKTGTYEMKRGGTINANITVNAVTDIDQTFTLGGTN